MPAFDIRHNKCNDKVMEQVPFEKLVDEQVHALSENKRLAAAAKIAQEQAELEETARRAEVSQIESEGMRGVTQEIRTTLQELKAAKIRPKDKILYRTGWSGNMEKHPRYSKHKGWKMGSVDFVRTIYDDSMQAHTIHSRDSEGLFLDVNGDIFYYQSAGDNIGEPVDLRITQPCRAFNRQFDISEVRNGLASLVAKTRTVDS